RLKREFQRFFELAAVLWESETMLAHGHFQDIIDKPAETDIFVMILWSRLGTPLPSDRYRGLDGRVPVTRTEREFENAPAAREQRGEPDLIVYRKRAPPDPKFSTMREVQRELAAIGRQWEQLEAFWERHFETSDGHAKRAYNEFNTPDEFEAKLEQHLRD